MTFRNTAVPRSYYSSRMKKRGRSHLVIPDPQLKPGVPNEQLEWAGRYAAEKKPDVIINLGDHWDMPSLSYYDRGTMAMENRRYQDDVDAGNEGMRLFLNPIIRAYNRTGWWPELHLLRGNHEQRIERYVQANPGLEGKVGYDDLDTEGWKVHDFLQPVEIDGVYYAHFFANPMTGRPYGGMCHTRLKNLGFSFTMGHQQVKDAAERYLANGKVIRGLICGAFYQHDEDYKGPQGNNHWRGIILKHEVRDGNYDMMEVSLDFLRRRFG